MRPLAEAQAAVLDAVETLPVQSATLREARGLVLAEDVVASHDVPPFANSAMDGYAVRAEDVVAAPTSLRVLEDIPAGSVPTRSVQPATAIKIMTGAPLPAGADAVVKVEDTDAGSAIVEIREAAPVGTAVRLAGGDIAAGTTVLTAGTRLGAAHLGVLASVGVAFPKVTRRPTVAIMSTGDEVVPPETEVLELGKIRDTNRPTLQAALEDFGAVVVDYGIVPDDAEALNRTLGQASRNADVVVTSGGVSMGEYDLVKQELAALGTVEFWKVAMQPAKPFAFGSLGGTPLFGLPGNPVSVFVAFEQFLRPALLHMMGSTALFRSRVIGVADEDFATDPAKSVFVRAAVARDGDRLLVTKSGGQQSNVLTALALADAFAVVPVGVGTISAGDTVELELFRAPETRSREEALNA
ncbi:MAG: molybdopterin molybdotransferase MoeA [bacterium]|nr:molybdopterin molybdotransferase MoeA [bacterium]